MTVTGLPLESPKIGQTNTFLQTAQATDGEELVIEARMRPGAGIPRHRHLRQEETFEVLAGTGTFSVAGRKIVRQRASKCESLRASRTGSATRHAMTFSSARRCGQRCGPRSCSSSCSGSEPRERSTSSAPGARSPRCG
jgi:hypothetical protein